MALEASENEEVLKYLNAIKTKALVSQMTYFKISLKIYSNILRNLPNIPAIFGNHLICYIECPVSITGNIAK